MGFAAEVELGDLAALARAKRVAMIEDLGSGSLVDVSVYGLPKEPVIRERIALGADVVTFSGDKLLGGPQAGIIVGRRKLIEAIRRNPLKRALRCDKMTLAALDATLQLYRTATDLEDRLPTLRALTRSIEDIERTAMAAEQLLPTAPRVGLSDRSRQQ